MEMLKSSQTSEFDFEKEYLIQLNNLNAKIIFEQINLLTSHHEPILMTHRKKKKKKKKNIQEKRLKKELGVTIKKIKIWEVRLSKKKKKKITQKRLFENE